LFQRLLLSARAKKCFVCHKEGCWLLNYPCTELLRARRQYVSAYEGFHEGSLTYDAVILYIMDFEGMKSDKEDDDDNLYDEKHSNDED
jgi:hypothetical protein